MTTGRTSTADCGSAEFKSGLPVLSFASPADWEAWLAAQPADAPGLWLRLAKKSSGIASVTKAEAVEGALCHGWIDGQLAKYDDRSWLVRFTPRTRKSAWSQVNCATATALIASGRMRPAGLAEIERARADGRWAAAYEPQSRAGVPVDLEAALDAAPRAKQAFAALDRRNRYAVLYHIQNAKKPETRARRIADFVAILGRGETIYPQRS